MFYIVNSTQAQVRIAFVGNSITMGLKLSNPSVECYPNQVNLLLKEVYGDTCQIYNSGVSGRTMFKSGDRPIWNENLFKSCIAWAPDICYIMLGTNDTKSQNWEPCGEGAGFLKDYKAMIDTFRFENPNILFIVAYPPPAIVDTFEIRNDIIHNGVMPGVDSIVNYAGAELVDLYHPLLDSTQLFPDGIHPNAIGAKIIAKIIFDKIISSDLIHRAKQNSTSIINVPKDLESIVYPNPFKSDAYFNIFVHKPAQMTIKVFDISGRLCINQTQFLSNTGKQIIELNTNNLLRGS